MCAPPKYKRQSNTLSLKFEKNRNPTFLAFKSFVEDKFPQNYVPTVFDMHTKDIIVDGKNCLLTLWDTAGQEDYDRIRPLSYPDTDVFIVCFALDNPESLDNINSKWIPELKHHSKNAKIILVGTKFDLRKSSREDCIPESKGRNASKEIEAFKYIECSAMTQDGLYEVFDTAIKAVLAPEILRPNKRKCIIL